MKLYHKALLYQNKWVQPYVRILLGLTDGVTYFASLLLIVGMVYEQGFNISAEELLLLNKAYRFVWIVFLTHTTAHLLLEYHDTRRNFRSLTWILSTLLYLTLVPVLFFEPDGGAVRYVWLFLHGKVYHLLLLLLLSFLQLSNGFIRLLGRRTNPSLILGVSFLAIICVGTGLLMLPNSTIGGISLIDSLFTATSAVCVTGLTSVDVSSTFTSLGLLIIIILIQIGGLGVMTLTSFFAMFFMGNTSLYNQVVVRDMVNSNSLGSLFSTLLYILGFTLTIEAIGMIVLFCNIHGTLGMELQDEIAFAAFHSISAFCNAGFSTLPGNLGNPLLLTNHNLLYITISFLIILGGIGFPILSNMKSIVGYHLKRLFRMLRTHKNERLRVQHHLYNLNTKIVLLMTFLLLFVGSVIIAFLEWDHAFAGMSVADKITQSFFSATSPRTAGFNSVGMTTYTMQTLLVMVLLMWIGGGSQSTAGGIKVNAFSVIILNLVAVLRGSSKVEVFGRELSTDSIRRSNATMLMSFIALFSALFLLTLFEPDIPLFTLVFECVSALGTVGLSLDATPLLCTESKIIIAVLMFVGRVGLITLMLGIVRQKKITKYRYPSDNIIIN